MFWKARRNRPDPDSAWKLQNEEQKENRLYRYINLQKEGRLVEVYEKEGLEALERVVRLELTSFLYSAGHGKTVTKIEYVKWRNACIAKMNVSRNSVSKL